jgi:inward rectifier potassium channel
MGNKPKKKHRAPLRMSRDMNRRGNNSLKRNVRFQFSDAYHSILSQSWQTFLATLLLGYLGTNLFFALGYFLCGPEALTGLSADPFKRYLDVFFFSVQTLSTIGYGHLAPVSLSANILVTLESVTGLMGFALVTGIIFSRFARPTARVVFSNVAVITKHDGVESFIFRIGNERLNQIVEARVSVVLVIEEKTKEGETYRTLYDLDLERSQSPLFTFSWTVVHPITEKSPMYKLTKEKLIEKDAEVLVTVAGVDDTFSQTIHSRYSYMPDQILWDRTFVDILKRTEDSFLIDMDNIHTTRPL